MYLSLPRGEECSRGKTRLGVKRTHVQTFVMESFVLVCWWSAARAAEDPVFVNRRGMRHRTMAVL